MKSNEKKYSACIALVVVVGLAIASVYVQLGLALGMSYAQPWVFCQFIGNIFLLAVLALAGVMALRERNLWVIVIIVALMAAVVDSILVGKFFSPALSQWANVFLAVIFLVATIAQVPKWWREVFPPAG